MLKLKHGVDPAILVNYGFQLGEKLKKVDKHYTIQDFELQDYWKFAMNPSKPNEILYLRECEVMPEAYIQFIPDINILIVKQLNKSVVNSEIEETLKKLISDEILEEILPLSINTFMVKMLLKKSTKSGFYKSDGSLEDLVSYVKVEAVDMFTALDKVSKIYSDKSKYWIIPHESYMELEIGDL